MKRIEPQSPLSRLLAVGLLVALTGGGAIAVVAPALEARAAVEAALSQQRSLKARLEQLGARAASRASHAPAAGEAAVVTAASPALAAAALQARLDAAIADAGARPEQLQAEAPAAGEGAAPQSVRATASFAATTAQLSQILFAVETGRPLVIVDKLVVQAQPRAEGARDETMRVELTARAMVAR